MLLEFQKAVKQMTAKPIVDYFRRVCDATIMHENFLVEWLKKGSVSYFERPWLIEVIQQNQ